MGSLVCSPLARRHLTIRTKRPWTFILGEALRDMAILKFIITASGATTTRTTGNQPLHITTLFRYLHPTHFHDINSMNFLVMTSLLATQLDLYPRLGKT